MSHSTEGTPSKRLAAVVIDTQSDATLSGRSSTTSLIQSDLPEQEVHDEPYVEHPAIEEVFEAAPRNPDLFRRHLQHSLRRIADLLIVQERSVSETALRMKRNQRFVRGLTHKLLARLHDVFGRSGLTIWGEPLRKRTEEEAFAA